MNTIDFKDYMFHGILMLCSLITFCLICCYVFKQEKNKKKVAFENLAFIVVILITTYILSLFIGNIITSIVAFIICYLYIKRINFN